MPRLLLPALSPTFSFLCILYSFFFEGSGVQTESTGEVSLFDISFVLFKSGSLKEFQFCIYVPLVIAYWPQCNVT